LIAAIVSPAAPKTLQSLRRLGARVVLRLFSSSGTLRMRVYRTSPGDTLRFIGTRGMRTAYRRGECWSLVLAACRELCPARCLISGKNRDDFSVTAMFRDNGVET
jgi:hypothetical protein